MATDDGKEAPEGYGAALQEAGVSVEEAARFYAVFKLFDRDNSESVDASELFSCLQVLGQTPMSQDEVFTTLQAHDKDADGKLDFVEFCRLMQQLCKRQQAVQEALVANFQLLDRDGNGYLDRVEIRALVLGNWGQDGMEEGASESGESGVALTEKELDELLQEADTNGDGKIDYNEFAALLLTDVSAMIENRKKKLQAKEAA